MIKYSFRLELDEETMTDIMEMAKHAGRPGNRVAGLCALIAEWRRLKAAHEAAMDFAAQIARHEERLDAQERHEDAEGCGYRGTGWPGDREEGR